MPDNPFSKLADLYSYQKSAEALFFRSSIHHNVKALRVLVPDLKIEFSDNNYIGTGAFLFDLGGPDCSLMLCYLNIVKILAVSSTTMVTLRAIPRKSTRRSN